MAGSWREILESAAAVERADAEGSVRPGEARRDAESQGGERSPSMEFHPPAESRRFGEPELAAFLTRLATPPDAGSAVLAASGAAPPPPMPVDVACLRFVDSGWVRLQPSR
jgi:hypothetical protein